MSKLKTAILICSALVLGGSAGLARADAAASFVYVATDAALKAVGMTRDQYNAKTPAAEKRWREAWAAAGTKRDNRALADIRQNTTKPADAGKSS